MRDLLSFLTGRIRTNKMTVDEFCSKVGISRQKFYRFVKEPRRFSSDHIRSMIDILSMNAADIEEFNVYLSPLQYREPSRPAAANYGVLISSLLSRKLSEEFALNLSNIEYTDESGSFTKKSPKSFAAAVSCFGGRSKKYSVLKQCAAQESLPLLHEFFFTVYNCIPDRSSFSGRKSTVPESCLTLASIVKQLEDLISIHSEVRVHMRHFLPDSQRKILAQEDIHDSVSMLGNLHIFDTILPLLSTMEDYVIDQSPIASPIWTEHDHVCLIRHSCSLNPKAAVQPETLTGASPVTEYYLLLFSDSGSCSACRLGEEEASHIYRFLSTDFLGKDNIYSQNKYDPNAFFSQAEHNSSLIMIHPDLCFEDIPTDMWLALYEEIRNRPERVLFEEKFRELMDPYAQYSFLSFNDLVYAALTTLKQRADNAESMGKIMICHPRGLTDLVRYGLITDLVSESFDYSAGGQNQTPLRFPPLMIKGLLENIRAGIVRRLEGGQEHPGGGDCYILDPKFPYPEITYRIHEVSPGIMAFYYRGRNKNKLVNSFPNRAVSTLLYNYVTEEMINRRRQGLESSILSDEHSITLIDGLITQLEQEYGVK